MTDNKILVDNEQLDRVLKHLEPRSYSFWASDRLLHLIQAVSLLIGGCWVLIRFIDFEREAKHISLKREELATQLAQFSLDYQRSQSSLRIAELTNSVRLKELEIQFKELEGKQAAIELTVSNDKRIEYSEGLEIEVLEGSAVDSQVQYLAHLTLSIKNISSVPLNIDFIVIDAFVQNLSDYAREETQASVKPLGIAPNFFFNDLKPKEGFQVNEWNWVSRESFISDTISESTRKFLEKRYINVSKIKAGGSAIGVWKPGETTYFKKRYIVKGTPGDNLAFVINVCFNGCDNGPDKWFFPNSKILPRANALMEHKAD